jgi:hypothetical protein
MIVIGSSSIGGVTGVFLLPLVVMVRRGRIRNGGRDRGRNTGRIGVIGAKRIGITTERGQVG